MFLLFVYQISSITSLCVFFVTVNKLWGEAQGNGGSIKRRIHWILEKVIFQFLTPLFISAHDYAFLKLFSLSFLFLELLRLFLIVFNFSFCRKSSGFSRGVSKYRGVARYSNLALFLLENVRFLTFQYNFFFKYKKCGNYISSKRN